MGKAHQPEPGGREMVVGVVTQDSLDPVLEVRLGEKADRVSKLNSNSGAFARVGK